MNEGTSPSETKRKRERNIDKGEERGSEDM